MKQDLIYTFKQKKGNQLFYFYFKQNTEFDLLVKTISLKLFASRINIICFKCHLTKVKINYNKNTMFQVSRYEPPGDLIIRILIKE